MKAVVVSTHEFDRDALARTNGCRRELNEGAFRSRKWI